jgi:hypothetical protein
MTKAEKEFAIGSKVVLTSCRANCQETIARLINRIGCKREDLFSGKLEVARATKGQISVTRPGKAGNREVASKFFELYTSNQAQSPVPIQETIAA